MPTKYDSLENSNEGLNGLPLVQRQLLALLRLALSPEPAEPLDPCLAVCKVDWAKLYQEAEKQSVVGIAWAGIEKLPKSQLPPMDWLMEWLGQAEYIKEQNGEVNKAVEEVVSLFRKAGMQGMVLKGQGLAQLYPQPELRTPGDIDYLIKDADIDRIVALARKNNPGYLHVTYHHCDFGKIQDTEVEAHWRASWFYTPWYNRRFQAFCQEHLDDSINHKPSTINLQIPTPSLAFNRVYVLVHIYRHLFFEGIGLRQIVDYYMVLQASAKDPMWAQQKIETMQRLKELGMERFTKAVMFVLKEALGMSEELLLCPVNDRDGRFLLSEIMRSGNFGKSDERMKLGGKSFAEQVIARLKRNLYLFRFGASEVLWTLPWRTWHYFWMKRHNSTELTRHN